MKKSAKLRLPHILRIAYDAGGIDAAIGLARALGGKRIRCPKKLRPHHPLCIAAGKEAAAALIARFGGDMIQIPQGIPARRVAVIEALSRPNARLNDAAEAGGVNVRTVSRIKAALEEGTAQTWFDNGRGPKAPKGDPLQGSLALPEPPENVDPRQIDLEDYLR